MRAIVPLVLLTLAGCATVRAVTRDLRNADLVGEPAPALAAGAWVGEPADLEGDWYLVAFLLPW